MLLEHAVQAPGSGLCIHSYLSHPPVSRLTSLVFAFTLASQVPKNKPPLIFFDPI